MIERKSSGLRAGSTVKAALGIRYTADDVERFAAVEAVEFLSGDGSSILVSCGADWTLQISEGRWPELPAWCWPVESWEYERIDEVGSSGFDRIVASSDIRYEVGQVCGVVLEFTAGWITFRAGEVMTWDHARKER